MYAAFNSHQLVGLLADRLVQDNVIEGAVTFHDPAPFLVRDLTGTVIYLRSRPDPGSETIQVGQPTWNI